MSAGRGRRHLAGLALAAAATLFVMAPALRGAFVYDDDALLLQNELIRPGGDLASALVSDPFVASRADVSAGSAYWRPAVVLWLAGNARLWGTHDPRGWHAANVVLQVAVLGAATWLLFLAGLDAGLAAAVLVLFAVHPTRAESVAWITGMPDVLMALGLFLALGFAIRLRERPTPLRWAGALAGFALALGAKETAVTGLAAVACVGALFPAGRPGRGRLRDAALLTAPFALLAGAYLAMRAHVLGGNAAAITDRLPFASVLATAPKVLAFYLRQLFLPLDVGVQYPLRPEMHPTWGSVGPPLLLGLAALALLALAARRSAVQALGFVLFLAPLLPVFEVRVFPRESIVHDRYLYLPLFGLLLVIVPAAHDVLRRALGASRGLLATLGLASAAAVLLAIGARDAAAAWRSPLTLWGRAARVDPTSATVRAQYAQSLFDAGRRPEARQALHAAFALGEPGLTGRLLRAQFALDEHRVDDARRDTLEALKRHPDDPHAWEKTALVLQLSGDLAAAERVLRAGRERFPFRRCAFTDNLSVVLHQTGRTEEAIRELEGARRAAANEYGPVGRGVFFHLGLMYAERGRTAEARRALETYLAVTTLFDDGETLRRRGRAHEVIAALPR